jgi:hypothetical protein
VRYESRRYELNDAVAAADAAADARVVQLARPARLDLTAVLYKRMSGWS